MNRALGKLVEIGAIQRSRGGRSTPSKITVIMSLDQFMAHYQNVAHQTTKNGPPRLKSGPPSDALRVNVEIQKDSKLARKSPSVEFLSHQMQYPPPTHIEHGGSWGTIR